VNGQIQYGSARPLTLQPTPILPVRPLADPARFREARNMSRLVTLLLGGSVLLAGLLVAAPRDVAGITLAVAVGGGWLSLVLAMTLPRPSERAGQELLRRLAEFRHELNTIGDAPSHATLHRLIARARELGLKEDEVSDELEQLRAAVEAVELRAALARGELPSADAPDPLPAGDTCHFLCAVRFGRRRSDQFGHLLLTSGWLKFRGPLDVTVTWGEVSVVKRDGREIVVGLKESRRVLRFSCHSLQEAARGAVIADHLVRAGGTDAREPGPEYRASL
jgi:hypothetical protein